MTPPAPAKASKWNRLLDGLLAEESLTVAEYRLTLAIARNSIGWNRASADVGQQLLRDTTGLDGRTFQRALDGLKLKRLVTVTGGRPGRGNRASYTLTLRATKTPAVERAFSETETPAVERAKPTPINTRSHDKKTPAVERARIEKKVLKTPPPNPELQRDGINAYQAAGGNLENDNWRNTLARQIKTARKTETPEHILAACKDLGRKNEFPGYLQDRIRQIQDNGGPCKWEGLDRSQITPQRLRTCGCHPCTEWANALDTQAIHA